jgi:uncharacterized membrane protein YphA (DoxX/SURF4 family)
MFLYSGTKKVVTLGKNEHKKIMRLGISKTPAKVLSFGAGVLEVVASLVVILAVLNVSVALRYKNLALKALILFTIVVTLLFKIWPQPTKMLGLTANLSVIGGLVLALYI